MAVRNPRAAALACPRSLRRIGWLDWVHYAETLAQHVARRSEPAAFDCLVDALDLLNAWLRESEWLLSGFSGADCQVGYSVWIASRVIPLEGHPALHAYLGRCEARPAFRAAFGATDVELT